MLSFFNNVISIFKIPWEEVRQGLHVFPDLQRETPGDILSTLSFGEYVDFLRTKFQ